MNIAAAVFALAFVCQQAAPPQTPSPAAQWRDDGRAAAAANDKDRAQRLFLQSLAAEPGSPETIRELLQLAADPKDINAPAVLLWSVALAEALADENGNIRIDAASKNILKPDPSWRALITARAEAAKEIVRTADKLTTSDSPSIAKWLREVGVEIIRKQPALEKKYSNSFAAAIAKTAPKDTVILNLLANAADGSLNANRPGEALAIARTLHGICVQAGQKDLMTPAPDLKTLRERAADQMERARELLKARETEIQTIAQLEQLSNEEKDIFTKQHSDPGNPGITNSPKGLYRLETICGIETLVSAATQVELHHRRIANWNGKDPFEGRPGIVRIVPRASDMDAEGTPYWWAGGFQSGDLTVLHFAHGTGGAMGRGLTHELTHRFDGALYPGMPAWLAEGRAVWTGGAYGNNTDDRFVENYASFGAISETYRKGMDLAYLKKLLTATLDDYRENYTAGHALWVYLWSWEPDKKIFRPQIDKYLTGLKVAKNPTEWFSQCFCDNKEGRPASLVNFAKDFGEFVKGFWWESPAVFLYRYVGGVAQLDEHPYILDRPTWHTDRVIAERYYGSGLATEAGRLLAKSGQFAPAAAAVEWGLSRDEMIPETARFLAELYEKQKKFDAVWAVETRLRARAVNINDNNSPDIPAQRLNQLTATVARIQNVLRAYAEIVTLQKNAGAFEAAAAFAADHNRLAALAGAKPIEYIKLSNFINGANINNPDPASRPAVVKRHPVCEPPVSLTIKGCVDDRLTGYDEYRVKDLFGVSKSGDVVLGRRGFAVQTGLQREAWLVQTFARGEDWLQGRYSISTRVRFLTSFGTGSLIIGYQRHDRQFRVNFNCGDPLYATQKKENFEGGDSAYIHFGDLRDREGDLAGFVGEHKISVTKDNPTFLLEVFVDGASAHVYANGAYLGTHTAATGLPIEGFVGFASGNGVIQIEKPTYQFHRSLTDEPRCACKLWPDGVDLKIARENEWDHLAGNRVRNINITGGCACVLWFPNMKDAESLAPDHEVTLPVEYTKRFVSTRTAAGLDAAPLILALPPTLTTEKIAKIKESLQNILKPADSIIIHSGHAGFDRWAGDAAANPGTFLTPWLLIVDSSGYLRVRETMPASRRFPRGTERWLRVLTER